MPKKTIAGLENELDLLNMQKREVELRAAGHRIEIERLKKELENVKWDRDAMQQALVASKNATSTMIGIIVGAGFGHRLVEHEAMLNSIRGVGTLDSPMNGAGSVRERFEF